MRAQILFRIALGLAVAALFVAAGRSRGPATANASQVELNATARR